jgi:hypothetical protein
MTRAPVSPYSTSWESERWGCGEENSLPLKVLASLFDHSKNGGAMCTAFAAN